MLRQAQHDNTYYNNKNYNAYCPAVSARGTIQLTFFVIWYVKKIILFFFLLIFISLLSIILFFHPEPVKFNTVTVDGKFSISIPTYLSKTDSIDPSALLQYKNRKEQLFLLVYEKSDTLHLPIEALFKSFSDDFISRIGRANLIKYYPEKINSHHAVIGNIRGTVNETEVYYRIAVIKVNDTTCFEIIVGTTENNIGQYDEDIGKILNEIKIIPPL